MQPTLLCLAVVVLPAPSIVPLALTSSPPAANFTAVRPETRKPPPASSFQPSGSSTQSVPSGTGAIAAKTISSPTATGVVSNLPGSTTSAPSLSQPSAQASTLFHRNGPPVSRSKQFVSS